MNDDSRLDLSDVLQAEESYERAIHRVSRENSALRAEVEQQKIDWKRMVYKRDQASLAVSKLEDKCATLTAENARLKEQVTTGLRWENHAQGIIADLRAQVTALENERNALKAIQEAL